MKKSSMTATAPTTSSSVGAIASPRGSGACNQGLGEFRVALICAEEDPARCHRRHLIAPALEAEGFRVEHLRADGSSESSTQLRERLKPPQPALFEQFDPPRKSATLQVNRAH